MVMYYDGFVAITDEEYSQLKRAEAELAEAKEQVHYANGVADLAMKHRDSAEAERDAMRELLNGVVKFWPGYMEKARATLAPSPAGQEE